MLAGLPSEGNLTPDRQSQRIGGGELHRADAFSGNEEGAEGDEAQIAADTIESPEHE